MSDLRKLFDWLFGTKATLSPARRKPRPSFKPQLEGLEDRIAPAGTVVDTAADDGSAGSLRQVLANAPANSTITFDPTVFPPNPGELAVISLNPTRGPISITANNLTIDGGQSDIAIDGQDQIRIFSIFGGNLTETIQNLQLMRGFGEVTENEGQEGEPLMT